jgi:hypothetical protein
MKRDRWSRSSLSLASTLVLLTGLAACSGGRSPSEPSLTDSISLSSISPAAGTKLAPGSGVTFSGTVNYTLGSAGTGRIVLVIQDQSGNLLTTAAQKTASILRGQGTVSLSDQITVPATGVTQIQVFFPLTPAGASQTNVVVHATYPVGP